MTDYEPLRGDSTGVRDAGREHSWHEVRDVVVVGLGGAGGSAALEAQRRGADVLVIDRFGGGGATGKSAGVIYFGGGTDLQRYAGYEDSPENMYNYLSQETDGVVPDETLRAFCETSVENFEWLRGLGVPFPPSGPVKKISYPADACTLYFSGNELCPPYSNHATPAPRGHRPLGKGLTGILTTAALRQAALRAGAELRMYTRAERLVIDGSGEVIGIVVRQLRASRRISDLLQALIQYGGGMNTLAQRLFQRTMQRLERRADRRFIRTRRGVILAAGGFIFNRTMMQENAPGFAGCSLRLGTAGDDGAGIKIGEAVGGALGQMQRCSAPRFIDPPSAWWRGVLVGRNGQRICNETLYGGKVGDHLVLEHEGLGTMILDAKAMNAGRAQILEGEQQLYQRAFGVINGYMTCRSANSIEQLARRMGIDPEALTTTIVTYNANASRGQDPLGKSPEHLTPLVTAPFFGIPVDKTSLLFPLPCLTLGGLRTEGMTSRVLRADGSVIDGLYATGRTAVGVSSNGYVSGLSVADGIFSGRAAARHAAARTKPARSVQAS